jgi:enamine deaminase RidA (YjgF/YER057c/UK114 family)
MRRIPGAVPTRGKIVISNGHIFLNIAPANKDPSTLAQAKDALSILDERLKEAGSDKTKLISVSVFVADIGKKEEINAAWDAWVDKNNPPIRACLGAQLEGKDLVELCVVAAE